MNRPKSGSLVAVNTGIYEIVSLSSGKSYIGSSCDIRKRWKVHRWHLEHGTHHSPYLQSSWNKYGAENFAFRILLVCARKHLVGYEQSALDNLRPAFNVAPRANMPNGVPMSLAGRKRLSDRMKGNTNTLGLKHTPESRARISQGKMGNTATKGRKLSPEHIAKVVASHRGSKRSAESSARISAAMSGKKQKPRSAEWRANLSAALVGKRKSPEHRAAISAAKRKIA
jgi:group I intron endonuclease